MDVLDRHEWKFAFVPKEYETLSSAEHANLTKKWDMDGGAQVVTFSFDVCFKKPMADDFLQAFFNSPEVRSVLRFRDETGYMANLGKTSVKTVRYEALRCSKVRMDCFDKLVDAGIVRENGTCQKMMDQFLPGGVTVADQMRNLFMNEEESEHRGLFSDDDKAEFLHHIMWRCVSGGAMCQYEDDFGVYKAAAKGIYKDLVSVQRAATGGIEAINHVYHVKDVSPLELHGRADYGNHNFCYLSINPLLRQVHYWYGSFASPF